MSGPVYMRVDMARLIQGVTTIMSALLDALRPSGTVPPAPWVVVRSRSRLHAFRGMAR